MSLTATPRDVVIITITTTTNIIVTAAAAFRPENYPADDVLDGRKGLLFLDGGLFGWLSRLE